SSARIARRELARMRLRTRVVIPDRQQALVGSHILRELELDARREIGVIFRDGKVIASLVRTFEEDWAASKPSKSGRRKASLPVAKTAKKVAKAVSKNLAAAPVVKKVVRELRKKTNGQLGDKQVKQALII